MSRDTLHYIASRKQVVVREMDALRNRRQALLGELVALQHQENQLQFELRNLDEAHFAELHSLFDVQPGVDQRQKTPFAAPNQAAFGPSVGSAQFHETFPKCMPVSPLSSWLTDGAQQTQGLGLSVSNAGAISFQLPLPQLADVTGIASASTTPAKPAVPSLHSAENDGAVPKKRAKSAAKIGLDELQTFISNIAEYWNRDSRIFDCPVCSSQLKCTAQSNVCLHLVDHLGEKAYFPYRCPLDGCDYASVRHSCVQSHVKSFHKLEWTEEFKRDSVHAENKALIYSFFGQSKTSSSSGNADESAMEQLAI